MEYTNLNENLELNQYGNLVPNNYLNISWNAERNRNKLIKLLLEKKKIPDTGWDDITIEYFVNQLSRMDSNNFLHKTGVGEREGRIICGLVSRRHYNFAHGIGRSGDLMEPQPKASGSSLMSQLVNCMLLDLIKFIGIPSVKKCLLLPLATGMTLMLCFLSLKAIKSEAKYILWSRIDQKSCFKSIITAGLIPIIIDPILEQEELVTNIEEFHAKINELEPKNILAIMTTSSCFAPRACDNIVEISKLSKKYNIPHIVNNAYGLQSSFLSHQIEQGIRLGRIDIFVQSTDKNLLVPVGGAIVAGFDSETVDKVSKIYAGRSSSSQTLDVFMTLLSLGKSGYKDLIQQRKDNFTYLKDNLKNFCEKYSEQLFVTKRNPISLAISLKNFNQSNCSKIGSMLFTRGISGARVINLLDNKNIENYEFQKWGASSNTIEIPYLTIAAGLGITKNEIDVLMQKLSKIVEKVKQNELNDHIN